MIARGLTLFYTLYSALARILDSLNILYIILLYIAETNLAEIFFSRNIFSSITEKKNLER